VHRRGSNAINGEYYADHNPENQWMPTFSMRALNLSQLNSRYHRLIELTPEEVSKTSFLKTNAGAGLPWYFYSTGDHIPVREVRDILKALQNKPYWEGEFADSNPYIGDGPAETTEGDYRTTQVGDLHDTSPFRFGEDVKGISTRAYISNMARLIRFLVSE
jgi:hypothetical protein